VCCARLQELQLTASAAEVQALRGELESERLKHADLEAQLRDHRRVLDPSQTSISGFITNKKNEDDEFDVEAAVLTGALCDVSA
jgi:hypothetical protein